MLVAVVAGVLVSLRLSLGKESQQKPAFTWWVINRLAFLVAASNLASFLLYFLQERFPQLHGNAAAQPATLLVMATGIAILVAALPAGWLADKIGTKPLLAVSGILAAAGALVVIAAQDMPMMTMGAVLVGAASGAFYSSNWALGTQLVPKEEAGRYLGISNFAGAGAGAIGAYIGGPIGDSAGYVVQMAIYAALFLFSTLALLRIKPANHQPEQA
jgi:MFS family permease